MNFNTYALMPGDDNWIYNAEESNYDDADIVVFPGGSDVDPSLYNHSKIKETHSNRLVDNTQWETMLQCIKDKKFIIGICKGAQLATAMVGGFLIQDVSNHHSSHDVIDDNGNIYDATSSHHQMCYPYELERDKYKLLAYSKQLSTRYIIQNNEQLDTVPDFALDDDELFKEPEVIYYPTINCLAIQPHPEWMDKTEPFVKYLNSLILKYFKKKNNGK